MDSVTKWFNFVTENRLIAAGVSTLLIVLLVIVGRTVSLRFVRNAHWPSDQVRLRVTVQVKRAFYVALLLGLLIVWGAQLRMLALSVVAIAAAIVIGTKELLMCVLGSIVRTSTKSYGVGDRVEIAGLRGDVIDYGLLGTTILEIGPGHLRTGRALVFPNSLLLNNAVVNETYTDEYVLHMIAIPVPLAADWREAQSAVLAAAEEVCGPYIEPARQHMNAVSKEHGLGVPTIEPKLIVQLPEAEQMKILVRVPTPAREKGRVEQAILTRVLEGHSDALLPRAARAEAAGQ